MSTRKLDESVPNAGAAAISVSHAFDLVGGGGRSQDEAIGEAASAQTKALWCHCQNKEEEQQRQGGGGGGGVAVSHLY